MRPNGTLKFIRRHKSRYLVKIWFTQRLFFWQEHSLTLIRARTYEFEMKEAMKVHWKANRVIFFKSPFMVRVRTKIHTLYTHICRTCREMSRKLLFFCLFANFFLCFVSLVCSIYSFYSFRCFSFYFFLFADNDGTIVKRQSRQLSTAQRERQKSIETTFYSFAKRRTVSTCRTNKYHNNTA